MRLTEKKNRFHCYGLWKVYILGRWAKIIKRVFCFIYFIAHLDFSYPDRSKGTKWLMVFSLSRNEQYVKGIRHKAFINSSKFIKYNKLHGSVNT